MNTRRALWLVAALVAVGTAFRLVNFLSDRSLRDLGPALVGVAATIGLMLAARRQGRSSTDE